jgi:hypothetical protein
VLAFKAYTFLSREPTYTTPFANAGAEKMGLPVAKLHCVAPVLVFRAYKLLSSEGTYTNPFPTAGEVA